MLAAALTTLLLVGCSGGAEVASGPDAEAPSEPAAPTFEPVSGRVVILCSRDEPTMAPLWEIVRSRHPDLYLAIEYDDYATHLARLRAGEGPRADLLLGAGTPALVQAAADGLLQPLIGDLLTPVPAQFRGEQGRWVALGVRARVVVARRILASKPQSVTDLVSPRFKGRLARTTSDNARFVEGVASMLADLGEQNTRNLLIGIDRNSDGNVHPDQGHAVEAVAAREADLALVDHPDFYRLVLGADVDPRRSRADAERLVAEANTEAIYPDSETTGVGWSASGGGVISGATNPEQAIAVLEVALSDEGQQAYTRVGREYGVLQTVAPAGARGADTFHWDETPRPELAARHDAAVALIEEIGLP